MSTALLLKPMGLDGRPSDAAQHTGPQVRACTLQPPPAVSIGVSKTSLSPADMDRASAAQSTCVWLCILSRSSPKPAGGLGGAGGGAGGAGG
eukprot:scaffold117_cov99-Isochrysis_galbana.AAC.5